MNEEKPMVELTGLNGNAFCVLGACKKASRDIWTEEKWKTFRDEATSGDYEHLLITVMEFFEVE